MAENQIEIVVTGRAKGLDQVERDAKTAGKKAGDGLGRGLEQGAKEGGEKAKKRVKDELDEAAKQAEKSGREAGSSFGSALSDSLAGGMSGIGGGVGGDLFSGLGEALSSGAGALAVGGGLLAGAVATGFTQAMEEKRIGGLVAAQLGEGSEQAGRLGQIAGEVYGANFGDSLEHVGEAMRGVLTEGLVDPESSGQQIREVTEQVLTVSQVIGEETGRIARSARTMLVNGLADNAREAFDMITHASQEGINTAGDLLDTIDEYSGQFSRLGLEGAESMGLLSQALKGGARDSDFAADALKEFAIRAQDMSPVTARGFRTMGLDAEVMGQRIARGGDAARGALDETLDGLRNIHDPILRNQAAVDLFGTKAEDLGQALFDMDLDSASKDFGEFAGATAEASDRLGEAAPFWENMGRNITTFLGDVAQGQDTLDNLYENMDQRSKDVLAAAREFKATGDTSALDALKDKYPEIAGNIDTFIEKQKGATAAVADADDTTAAYVETLTDLIDKNKELAGGVLDLSDAQIGYEEAVDTANEAVKENGKTLDLNTQAGRDNRRALDDLVDRAYNVASAMETQGASTREVQAHMKRARTDFINAARAMGMSEAAAQALANKLGLIPGNYTANVVVRTAQATAMINSLIRRINQMPSERVINMRVNTSYSGMGGHQLPGQAHGGVLGASRIPRAESGGVRSATTMINEAGPEIVELPTGSRVMTAGTARAAMEAGMFAGGGGGVMYAEFVVSGAADTLFGQAIQQAVRRGLVRLQVNGVPVGVR